MLFQAALLLTNLTSQPLPLGSVETVPSVWQGPVVRNEETGVSLVGLSALLALLHHSNFYQQVLYLALISGIKTLPEFTILLTAPVIFIIQNLVIKALALDSYRWYLCCNVAYG